jgi:hypothetical protein
MNRTLKNSASAFTVILILTCLMKEIQSLIFECDFIDSWVDEGVTKRVEFFIFQI